MAIRFGSGGLQSYQTKAEKVLNIVPKPGSAIGRTSNVVDTKLIEQQKKEEAIRIEQERKKVAEQQAIEKQKQIKEAIEKQKQDQIKKVLAMQSEVYNVSGMSPSDIARNFSPTQLYEKQTGSYKGTPTTMVYSKDITGTEREATPEEFNYYRQQSNTLQVPKESKGIIQKSESYISRKKSEILTESGRGKTGVSFGIKSTLFGLGSGSATAIIGTGKFVKGIVTEPIETTKQTVTGIKSLATGVSSGTLFASAGQILRQNPSYALGFGVGYVGTEYATMVGIPKGVTKVSDIVRTRGLTELKSESIIAPEYFKGQQYPGIARGQTAGSLLKEFKPILKGETKSAGFTASPSSFKKSTAIQRGTSELPGLYQSPMVSPKFLKVEGESKVFSLRLVDTLRPTVIRVTPKKFELSKGIKSTQKNIGSLKEAKVFFEKAPKGISYVPFVKAEKEAVIPYGTGLLQTQKRFYFKFEGRRIPIFEYKVTEETGDILKARKIKDVRQINKISSSGRIRTSGSVNPLSLSSSFKGVSSRGLLSKGSYTSSISKSKSLSSSLSYPKSTSSIVSKGSYGKSSSYPSLSKSISFSGYTKKGYGGSSIGRYTSSIIIPPPSTKGFSTKSLTSGSSQGLFSVSVRRRKKFRTIGAGLTLNEALTLGKGRVSRTLAATFRLTPTRKGSITGGIGIPKGFYQKNDLTFIQQRKYRLSTGGEKGEIKYAKRIRT